MLTQIQNLNKQIQLSVEIDTLMAQSLKLMDIVNENQKRVNEIKKEQEQLQLHIDNSTDNLKEADDIRGGW
jgi:predicted  nucleic acid-binding Zn-ribbon protein